MVTQRTVRGRVIGPREAQGAPVLLQVLLPVPGGHVAVSSAAGSVGAAFELAVPAPSWPDELRARDGVFLAAQVFTRRDGAVTVLGPGIWTEDWLAAAVVRMDITIPGSMELAPPAAGAVRGRGEAAAGQAGAADLGQAPGWAEVGTAPVAAPAPGNAKPTTGCGGGCAGCRARASAANDAEGSTTGASATPTATRMGALGAERARAAGLEVSRERLARAAELGARFVVLDVREPDEWRRGHLPGSLHVPLSQVERVVPARIPSRDQAIVVCCARGRRSLQAVEMLRALGYRHVWSLADGLVARETDEKGLGRLVQARGRISQHDAGTHGLHGMDGQWRAQPRRGQRPPSCTPDLPCGAPLACAFPQCRLPSSAPGEERRGAQRVTGPPRSDRGGQLALGLGSLIGAVVDLVLAPITQRTGSCATACLQKNVLGVCGGLCDCDCGEGEVCDSSGWCCGPECPDTDCPSGLTCGDGGCKGAESACGTCPWPMQCFDGCCAPPSELEQALGSALEASWCATQCEWPGACGTPKGCPGDVDCGPCPDNARCVKGRCCPWMPAGSVCPQQDAMFGTCPCNAGNTCIAGVCTPSAQPPPSGRAVFSSCDKQTGVRVCHCPDGFTAAPPKFNCPGGNTVQHCQAAGACGCSMICEKG